MSNKNEKEKKSRLSAIIPMILLTVLAVAILYVTYLKDTPTFRFAGRFLNAADGGNAIRSRRVKSDKPYSLTKDQKYYKDLVDKNNINVLVIGPDQSGANYDTLMIASIDDTNNDIKLINLPRDIYIEYSDSVKKALKEVWPSYSKSKGIYKINAAHTLGKKTNYKNSKGRFGSPEFDFTADLIEEVFGIYIDDYIFIKPSSVRRVVDYFGGVEIEVPYQMKYSDPTQDLTINLKKGLQKLNGAQAEGFLRYRQGVDEKGKYKSIGDTGRKENQVAFVNAFIDQHMTLKNIGKFINIYNDLDSYVTSSVDTPEKAGDYGKLAEKLYKNNFTKSSETIECSNVNLNGVYYLKIKTE